VAGRGDRAGAQRLGLRPTALTITNLVLGWPPRSPWWRSPPGRRRDVPAWVVGLVALVGWQVAYALTVRTVSWPG
jgi:hypothetical protein